MHALCYLLCINRSLKPADRWSGCVTVCAVLSERCVEGYSKPPALALRGPSLRDRGRRSGNWAHMMFFHRHKGDLGEIHGEPRELRLSGSHGKWEGKGESTAHARRKERKSGRRRVEETLSLLLHFIWHHSMTQEELKAWMNVKLLLKQMSLHIHFWNLWHAAHWSLILITQCTTLCGKWEIKCGANFMHVVSQVFMVLNNKV